MVDFSFARTASVLGALMEHGQFINFVPRLQYRSMFRKQATPVLILQYDLVCEEQAFIWIPPSKASC